MPEITTDLPSSDQEIENFPPGREEKYKLQFPQYILSFLYIFWVSFWIPLTLFAFYALYVFLPAIGIDLLTNFPAFQPIIAPSSPLLLPNGILTIFTKWDVAVVFLTFPLVIAGFYLLHMFLTAVTCRQLLNRLRKKCPPQEIILVRSFSNPNREHLRHLNYHHFRSYIMRLVKWKFCKGPFPWLQNWMFRYLKAFELGSGVVFEPHFYASELCAFGDDAYIGPGCIPTSHVVEGVWGRLIIMEVKLGRRAAGSGENIIGCGDIM
ncbi:MAG TPA: hypothetical protein VKK79_00840, partial [Candidatus Lokiarchaeia archaeon]|nr:hypothetical protein [Candidatus Lokiarchaeia archaeon]